MSGPDAGRGVVRRNLPSLRCLFALAAACSAPPAPADGLYGPAATGDAYLADIRAALQAGWPHNRTIHVVCHGHSVPAGYFRTPAVDSLHAYPHLLRAGLAAHYPHAVVNVIVTAIGGEDSVRGAARFETEVCNHRPDVVLIDYGLNDRRIGLVRAKLAWTGMITKAKARGIKVLLLTPTPDLRAAFADPQDALQQHAGQIRALAREHEVLLIDSHRAFQDYVRAGGVLADVMSQSNHPDAKGHELVAALLLAPFLPPAR